MTNTTNTATQQTALVTGANKGLGFQTARQLAQLGFTVWLGCRDEARGKAAAGELAADGDVRLVSLDINNQASVAAAATRIDAQTGPLDVLVNNVGVAFGDLEGPPSTMLADTIRRTLEVNFFSTLSVTQAFLPLVRRSPVGRIVNVSTSLSSLTTVVSEGNPLGSFGAFAYPVSKTMLNALTAWLAVELADTAVKVNSVCPGFNATDMTGHAGQDPSEGAKAIVQAATIGADGPTGTFFDINGPVPW